MTVVLGKGHPSTLSWWDGRPVRHVFAKQEKIRPPCGPVVSRQEKAITGVFLLDVVAGVAGKLRNRRRVRMVTGRAKSRSGTASGAASARR
jgi:hypothetical protein